MKDVSGIITNKIHLRAAEEKSVHLKLELSARPELEIPESVRKITAEIKEYMEKYSGIEVSHVEISMQPLKQNQNG